MVQFMDTPGLDEREAKGEGMARRSDAELRQLVMDAVTQDMPLVDCVLLVVPQSCDGADVDAILAFAPLFHDESRLAVVLTQSETLLPDDRARLVQQLLEHPLMAKQPVLAQRLADHVFFSGALVVVAADECEEESQTQRYTESILQDRLALLKLLQDSARTEQEHEALLAERRRREEEERARLQREQEEREREAKKRAEQEEREREAKKRAEQQQQERARLQREQEEREAKERAEQEEKEAKKRAELQELQRGPVRKQQQQDRQPSAAPAAAPASARAPESPQMVDERLPLVESQRAAPEDQGACCTIL